MENSNTQTDKNEITYQIYELWDNELNSVWKILKRNIGDYYWSLASSENAWIDYKEQTLNFVGWCFGNGNLSAVQIKNETAIQLTKERIMHLLTYLNDIK